MDRYLIKQGCYFQSIKGQKMPAMEFFVLCHIFISFFLILAIISMNPHFHYIVDSLFYRKDIGDKFDFLMNNGNINEALVKTQKEFHNDSPILAREEAFNHFQSYVEVLYEGIHKKYTSDEKARIDLQKYFNSHNDVELMGSKPGKFKISDDIFNGINIYMVIDVPLTKKEKKGDKFLVHGIRYIDYPDKPDDEITSTIKGLVKECEYYELGQYPFGQYYSFVDFDKIGGKS